ncbi:MAG: hypothetical protein BGO08_09515 [Altererythrobacter sp. 66-12]|nr:MAG: hypothetical protein BGO08_09515 [Altererythrobacter sp. 66-12]
MPFLIQFSAITAFGDKPPIDRFELGDTPKIGVLQHFTISLLAATGCNGKEIESLGKHMCRRQLLNQQCIVQRRHRCSELVKPFA